MKLYKAFIFRCFATGLLFGISVVHARNTDKVDNLNKPILRPILQDYSSPYDILLSKVNLKSLMIRRLQNFTITLCESVFC